MLDSLIEATLINKNIINEQLNRELDKKIPIDDYWNNVILDEKPLDSIISSSDGSINQINYLSFILYAVSANCQIYTGNGTEKIDYSDVNMLFPYRHVRDRLRNYMSIFELKTTLKAFNNFPIDLHLFDGSIMGSIIRPTPLDNRLSSDLEEIQKEFFPLLNEEIKNQDKIYLISQTLLNSNGLENELNAIIHLERLENLIVTAELLKNKNIIGISKTSLSNDYFHMNIPDMAIFDKLTTDTGFSNPLYINISKRAKRSFPILNEFFRKLEFTTFYARLENNKSILKFEVPYRLSSKNKVIELLEIVKTTSTNGYPYLLKKAHEEVKIRNKDMEMISKKLNIMEKKWRSML